MQTADVRAKSERLLGSEKKKPGCMFFPLCCITTFYPSSFFLQKNNIHDGAVHSHSLQLIHSTRPSDLREEIKMFQTVTEPVGDRSNLIIRLHPVWAAADSFYGALGRIHSCCWKYRTTLQVGSFVLKWESIFQAEDGLHKILATSGSEIWNAHAVQMIP